MNILNVTYGNIPLSYTFYNIRLCIIEYDARFTKYYQVINQCKLVKIQSQTLKKTSHR